MGEIHQSHMGKMKPEMMTMMKPMMEKMQAEKAIVNGHIIELEKALQVLRTLGLGMTIIPPVSTR